MRCYVRRIDDGVTEPAISLRLLRIARRSWGRDRASC
jgi:hypothetical protein